MEGDLVGSLTTNARESAKLLVRSREIAIKAKTQPKNDELDPGDTADASLQRSNSEPNVRRTGQKDRYLDAVDSFIAAMNDNNGSAVMPVVADAIEAGTVGQEEGRAETEPAAVVPVVADAIEASTVRQEEIWPR